MWVSISERGVVLLCTMRQDWSRLWSGLKFSTWNCFSYSNERYEYVKSLKHDVVALTELHGRQLDVPKSKLWITSPRSTLTPNGKSTDSAAGVTLLLSPRVGEKMCGSGHVGPRIVWVRFQGPV